MKAIALSLIALAGCAFPLQGSAEIKTEEVEYSSGGTKMKGYFAWDASKEGKRPGVIVVHEWWGLNDYARDRARQLAALGYTALAVDMFGDGKVAAHPNDARAFVGEVMKESGVAAARFAAGMDTLKKHSTVDTDRIAAIGYCFGGSTVLNAARQGVDLDAVASFHGSLGGLMPIKPPVLAKVLVCHGDADEFISAEQIEAFRREMTAAGVDYEFLSLPGAKHGFSNPGATEAGTKFGIPVAYDAAADAKSWAAMQALFAKVFP